MDENPEVPDVPSDAPSGAPSGVDPAALLAFVQRLMSELAQGGDLHELLAQAPPGFAEVFSEAQRRLDAGQLDDLGLFVGGDAAGGTGGLAGLAFPFELGGWATEPDDAEAPEAEDGSAEEPRDPGTDV